MQRRRTLIALISFTLLAGCATNAADRSLQQSELSNRLELVKVADIPTPVAFATRLGDESNIGYIASQSGEVYRIDLASGRSSLVVSLADRTKAEGERGLLGIAFSRDGNEFYAHFTDVNGDTNVVALPVVDGEPNASQSRQVFFHEQPHANHNGGQLLVDSTGSLLIGLGDGGSSGDPEGNGQDRSSLLGKILRINPNPASDRAGYSIPPDNPYANSTTTAPEILFLGVRNPWRFTIDEDTGDFWIADVGQNTTEEINRVPATGVGANLGWNLREGSRAFKGSTTEELTDPVYEWPNPGGASAIGGFVYRGSAIPELKGRYVFADFGQRGLLTFDPSTGSVTKLDLPISSVVAFGQDNNQELYVLSLTSGFYALRPSR